MAEGDKNDSGHLGGFQKTKEKLIHGGPNRCLNLEIGPGVGRGVQKKV